MDNEEIMALVADELGVSSEAVEKFFTDECGAYADLGDDKIWISGSLIARIVAAVT